MRATRRLPRHRYAIASAMAAQDHAPAIETFVVHGGNERATMHGTTLLPWTQIDQVAWH